MKISVQAEPLILNEDGINIDNTLFQNVTNVKFVENYVISPIDTSNKFSSKYFSCTGIVLVAKDKETGENISFMSHQDPKYFLNHKSGEDVLFLKDLNKALSEIKERGLEGTFEGVIYGGKYSFLPPEQALKAPINLYVDTYLEAIELLSKQITDQLGFEPKVAIGPKTQPSHDTVFYDNKNRILHIARSKITDDSMEGFCPSDIQNEQTKWKPTEWGIPDQDKSAYFL
jgi:hypothetical protein